MSLKFKLNNVAPERSTNKEPTRNNHPIELSNTPQHLSLCTARLLFAASIRWNPASWWGRKWHGYAPSAYSIDHHHTETCLRRFPSKKRYKYVSRWRRFIRRNKQRPRKSLCETKFNVETMIRKRLAEKNSSTFHKKHPTNEGEPLEPMFSSECKKSTGKFCSLLRGFLGSVSRLLLSIHSCAVWFRRVSSADLISLTLRKQAEKLASSSVSLSSESSSVVSPRLQLPEKFEKMEVTWTGKCFILTSSLIGLFADLKSSATVLEREIDEFLVKLNTFLFPGGCLVSISCVIYL